MRRVVFLGLLAACGGRVVTTSHPELEAEAMRTETIEIGGAEGRMLAIGTHAGDITVEITDGPPQVVAKLRLMARTEAEAERLLANFSVSGHGEDGVFVVRVEGDPVLIDGTEFRVRPLVAFHVQVPAGQRLRAETGSGTVEMKGAAGECTLVTAFGDIRAHGIRGESLHARTGSGNVKVDDVEASWIEVDTAFGDVRIERVKGGLDVKTGSGDVRIKGFSEGSCTIHTGFGNIDASGSFGDLTVRTSSGHVEVLAEPGSSVTSPWSLQSAFGDVEVRVPEGFDCDLFAETSFGCVTSDVTMHTQGKPTDQRMRGELGEGGTLVTLRTSSGDIRIRTAY